MNEQLIPASWFALGVALQALALIRGQWNWPKLGLCVGLAAFAGLLPGRHESTYEPLIHILFVLGIFAFMFATMYQRQILPSVGEKTLLSYTLVFWFAFFSYYYKGANTQVALALGCLLPSVATVFVALAKPKLRFASKLCLYAWFLCIVVALGLFQFPVRHLDIFLEPNASPWLTPVECIVSGMAFLYLAVNISYLYELIPIPSRSQSFRSRMAEWHALTDLMSARFDDEPPSPLVALAILVAQGGALFLNYRFHWLPTAPVVNLLIILPGLLLLVRGVTGSVPPLETAAGSGHRPKAPPSIAPRT